MAYPRSKSCDAICSSGGVWLRSRTPTSCSCTADRCRRRRAAAAATAFRDHTAQSSRPRGRPRRWRSTPTSRPDGLRTAGCTRSPRASHCRKLLGRVGSAGVAAVRGRASATRVCERFTETVSPLRGGRAGHVQAGVRRSRRISARSVGQLPGSANPKTHLKNRTLAASADVRWTGAQLLPSAHPRR